MNDTRTVFFVGKPGCGKGTQAKILSEQTGWANISAGRQFRTIATEETVLGHKVKAEIDSGALMPHWFAMYLYQKALFSLAEDSGVIFDGFNRKVPEAELIISSLTWLSRPFKVINLIVPDEVVRQRLMVRKEKDGRADDAVVDERLREYRDHTEAAIDLFRKHGNLVEIDGELPPEEIARRVSAAIGLA